MQLPWHMLNELGCSIFFLLAVTAATIFFSKNNRLTLALLFAGALLIFTNAVRGLELLALVCGYILIEAAGNFDFKNRWLASSRIKVYNHCLVVILIAALGIRVSGLMTEKVLVHGQYVRKVSLLYNSESNPMAGVEFLRKNNIEGKIFNSDTFGGYLIWTGYPTLRPFIDGRLLDNERLFRYIQVMSQPQRFWPQLEKDFGFQVAILKLSDKRVSEYLRTRPDWKLRFEDEGSQVFIKR